MGGPKKKVTGGVHTRSQAAAKEAKAEAAKLAKTRRAEAAANRNVAQHPSTRSRSVMTRDVFGNIPDGIVKDIVRRATAPPDHQSARSVLSLNKATSVRIGKLMTARFDSARIGLLVGFLRCAHELYVSNGESIISLEVFKTTDDKVKLDYFTRSSLNFFDNSKNNYTSLLSNEAVPVLAATVDNAFRDVRTPIMELWSALLAREPDLRRVYDKIKETRVVERILEGDRILLKAERHHENTYMRHQVYIPPGVFPEEDGNTAWNKNYDENDKTKNFYIYDPSFDAFRNKVCALPAQFSVPVELLNTGACMRAFADVLRQPDEDWLRGAMQMRFPKVSCLARGGRARKQK